MPEAMKYLEPSDMERRGNNSDFLDSERNSLTQRFSKGEKYYNGNHPNSLIVGEDDDYDDNVIINVTKQAFDRTKSFLVASMPRFQFNTDSDGETDEEKYIRECWINNGGAVFLDRVFSNGGKLGHNFVRLIPPTRHNPYVRLVNIKPGRMVAYWKADDMDTVIWYEMMWTIGDTEYLIDFINEADFPVDEQTEQWRIVQYSRRKNSNTWEKDAEEIWPFYFGPIVDWPHIPEPNDRYGRPETTDDQLSLNRSVNKIASDINRILRFHAFPKTIGTGIAPGDVQATSIDSFFATPNKDANIYNLEMKSDLASSMAMLQFLTDAFLAQARVVIMRGTVKDFQRVTNTGIRAVFLDMIAKNQVLRWSYGSAAQEISRRMLMVKGMNYEQRPDIIWDDPLPEDDTEAINNLAIELTHKLVSRETASKKRGYTWDEETSRMASESKLTYLQADKGTAPAAKEGNRPTEVD